MPQKQDDEDMDFENDVDEDVKVIAPKNINTFNDSGNSGIIDMMEHLQIDDRYENSINMQNMNYPLNHTNNYPNNYQNIGNINNQFSGPKLPNTKMNMINQPNSKLNKVNLINIEKAKITQNIYMNINTNQPNINYQKYPINQYQHVGFNQVPMQNQIIQQQMMYPQLQQKMLMNNNQMQMQYMNMLYQQKSMKQVNNNEINFNNIITREDIRTTLMIRNIPNKYSLMNIVDEIGSDFWGKYDCINLPIDIERKLIWDMLLLISLILFILFNFIMFFIKKSGKNINLKKRLIWLMLISKVKKIFL